MHYVPSTQYYSPCSKPVIHSTFFETQFIIVHHFYVGCILKKFPKAAIPVCPGNQPTIPVCPGNQPWFVKSGMQPYTIFYYTHALSNNELYINQLYPTTALKSIIDNQPKTLYSRASKCCDVYQPANSISLKITCKQILRERH